MSPIRMSRLESAMRVVLAFHEAFNRADAAAMLEMISDDCCLETSHPAPAGTTYTGRIALADYLQELLGGFSNVSIEIEDIFGAGLHCVMRWSCHYADAQNESRSLRGVGIFLVREGLIHEIYAYTKGGA